MIERTRGLQVEEAFARIGAVDAATSVGFGEGFEIGIGVAAEEGEAQAAFAAGGAVAGRGIAAEVAEQGPHVGKEGGALQLRILYGDVEFLLLAGGVELDIGFAIGDWGYQTALADGGDLVIRRFEFRLRG